jgi:hypothetical protein
MGFAAWFDLFRPTVLRANVSSGIPQRRPRSGVIGEHSRTRPFCPSTFRPLRKPTLFERLNFPPYSRSPLAVCGSRICAAF